MPGTRTLPKRSTRQLAQAEHCACHLKGSNDNQSSAQTLLFSTRAGGMGGSVHTKQKSTITCTLALSLSLPINMRQFLPCQLAQLERHSESPASARLLYKRLCLLFWVGSRVGAGIFGGFAPTFLHNVTIKLKSFKKENKTKQPHNSQMSTSSLKQGFGA